MDKFEILEKSRKENENIDEFENYALMNAGKWAVAIGEILCAVIFAVEAIFFDRVSLNLWAIFLMLAGVDLTVKYVYRKKIHELVFGVLELLIALALLIVHFVRLAG